MGMDKYQRIQDQRVQIESAVKLSGIKFKKVYELENRYWPDHTNYFDVRTTWYLFMTEYGPIVIGWRKRVISVNWEDTGTSYIEVGMKLDLMYFSLC